MRYKTSQVIFLICLVLFFCVCLFLFTKIKYKEDILVMVPSTVRNELSLFQSSPLSKKFFIVVTADDQDALKKSLDSVSAALSVLPGLRPTASVDAAFLLSFYYHLPSLWSDKMQCKAQALLSSESIEFKMQENILNLTGPQSAFMKDFILADPIGLMDLSSELLKTLNVTDADFDFTSGALVSKRESAALFIFDTQNNSFDRNTASDLIDKINVLNEDLGHGSKVFALGAARYTNENNIIINKDVKVVLILSVVFMSVIFLLFLRERRALFIYMVPVFVMLPAAVFTGFCFDALSGITLGFGAVLMGIAIDYSVYMYFAFKASPKEATRLQIVRAMFKPVLVSALTSIIAFVVLSFSGIPLLYQITVFAVCGLFFALFIAFAVAPLVFKPRAQSVKDFKTANAFNPYVCLCAVCVILVLGVISSFHLKFDTSLDSLNTVSPEFEKERAVFDALTQNVSENSSLLFVFARRRAIS
jgi:predicted exporter